MGAVSLRRSFIISGAAHALFLALLAVLAVMGARQSVKDRSLISVELLPRTDTRLFKKQVVQTEKGEKVKAAPDDAFLGEQNQVVDRQTVSKRTASQASHEQKSRARNVKPQVGSLARLGVPILPAPQQQKADEENWAEFAASPQDYAKGVKESDRTALNTKEYMFWGYFQRIRKKLDLAWYPLLREQLTRIYRQGRELASDVDHTTKVLVVMNDRGEVVRVEILGESGTQELDEAAINAFNRAGPFPNPPHGIIDADREVRIPWEFILKT